MDDRVLDLTEEQKATKAKYPPITKKYECKWWWCLSLASFFSLFTFGPCDSLVGKLKCSDIIIPDSIKSLRSFVLFVC